MSPRPSTIEEAIEQFLRERRSGSKIDARSFSAGYPELGASLVDALESAELLESAHAERDTAADELPERFGEFRVLERLGGGGMGVVYRARQETLGRDVALKLIRPEHLYFPNARERFRRETEAAARLQHPGLVPIYTVGEANGVPYFAMELVGGATLAQALRDLRARLPESLRGIDLAHALKLATPADSKWDESSALKAFHGAYVENILRLVIQVADALQHAHSRDVLHRDVKPSNVAITADGRALLFDFGLACLSDVDERLTATRGELGSLAYMSPEQLRTPPGAFDRRCDVYALGVTLYELLALRLPFSGRDALETRREILEGAALPLRVHNRAVPRDVEVVCAKAMERDPQRRYPDAAALARDLRNVLEKRPIEARPAGVALQTRRWMQRHPVATLALATLIAVPSVLFWRENSHARALSSAFQAVERQRVAAQIEARDALEINEFLTNLISAVDPSVAHGRKVTVQEMLDEAARQLDAGYLADQPIVRARLFTTIGASYTSLEQWESAERLLKRALELSESAAGSESLPVVASLCALASLEEQLGRPAAFEHARRAAEIHRRLGSKPTFQLADTLLGYGIALQERGRYGEADKVYHEALEVVEKLPPPQLSARAGVWANLANLELDRGNSQAALEAGREAVRLQREFDPSPHPAITTGLNAVALALTSMERWDEARAAYDELLEVERRLTGEASTRFAAFLVSKSNVEFATDRIVEATQLLERADELFARNSPETHGNALTCREKLATVYERAGRWEDSLEILRERSAAVEEAYGKSSGQSLANHVRIALCQEALGDMASARAELEAELERAAAEAVGDDDAWESLAAAVLATMVAKQGDVDSARALVQRARHLRDDAELKSGANVWTRLAAGIVAQCAGEFELARRELEPLAALERGPTAAEAAPALARARLAMLLESGDPARANELATRAHSELEKFLGSSHPEVRTTSEWIRAHADAAPASGKR